jgi:hypothetical protein
MSYTQDVIRLPHQILDHEDPKMMALAIYRNFKEIEYQLSLLQGSIKQATEGGISDLYTKADIWNRAGSINSDGTFSTSKLKGVINTVYNEIWAGDSPLCTSDCMLQSWQEGRADNVDNNMPLVLNIYIPLNTDSITQAVLRFRLLNFRAYITDVGTAGGHAHTLTTDFSSGEHEHVSVGAPDDGDHTHTLEVDDVSGHSHSVGYGIYAGTKATNVSIKINGNDVTDVLGGPFTVDQATLDVAPYLVIGQWNVIELNSTQLGRIDAIVFLQALIGI